jgi:superoxide dismutase
MAYDHDNYLQAYIEQQNAKTKAAPKVREDKTLERNPFIGNNANNATSSSLALHNIKSFIEKSKQPNKYYREHQDAKASNEHEDEEEADLLEKNMDNQRIDS